MNKYSLSIVLLLFLGWDGELYSQVQKFIVRKATFSSGLNDEFSPVYYRNGLVFCSNIRDNSPVGYKDGQSRLFKIVYVTGKGNSGWKQPVMFSKELTSGFNDGPATFNPEGTILYYNRNNSIGNNFRNISDTSNKLGIYLAELKDGIWTDIRPFPFNNPLYTFCTPSLSPDGKRIYFSSDMPGGYGGMDLYYCDSLENGWDRPVNLGLTVNTPKNESFPFADGYGILYFASDGLKGFGGKDIYFTREINRYWIDPVHLDSAINSTADDFGIVMDTTSRQGYFSSNRLKTDDIFSFSSAPVEFSSCDTIRENRYCFTFYDEQHKLIDTLSAIYLWDFGDGLIMNGLEVNHCFPGPGRYSVKLTILDEITGDTLAEQVNYDVDLEEIEQADIESYNIGISDNSISFGGLVSSLRGIQVTDFYWNFGDGFKPGGPVMERSFRKEGEYVVQLGLLGEKESTDTGFKKCVMKKIRIYDSYKELELKDEGESNIYTGKNDSAGLQEKSLKVITYFMEDLSERQKSQISAILKDFRKPELNINRYGILPSSWPLLHNISDVLKRYPDIRVEINVYATTAEIPNDKMEISEQWAQEVAFWFRNNETGRDILSSKGFGSARSPFSPKAPIEKTGDGVVEFIFMKN